MSLRAARRPVALAARVRRLEADLHVHETEIERQSRAMLTRWVIEREEVADLMAEYLDRAEAAGDPGQPATIRILSQLGGADLLDALTASFAADVEVGDEP